MEVGVAVTVWDAERPEPLDEPCRRLLTAQELTHAWSTPRRVVARPVGGGG